MDKADFQKDLISEPGSYVASKWLLERLPFVFGSDSAAHIRWKESLAAELEVDSRAMVITGSACCGFSLSPNKGFQDFGNESDVDVALISQHHFDLAWNTLRNLGTKRYSLAAAQKIAIEDHRIRLIYWGTIATDKILPLLPYGKTWAKALETAGSRPPLNNRNVKVRVYRDFESLRAYQLDNFEKLRTIVIEKKDTA